MCEKCKRRRRLSRQFCGTAPLRLALHLVCVFGNVTNPATSEEQGCGLFKIENKQLFVAVGASLSGCYVSQFHSACCPSFCSWVACHFCKYLLDFFLHNQRAVTRFRQTCEANNIRLIYQKQAVAMYFNIRYCESSGRR